MGWLGVMGSIASLAGPVLAGTIIDVGGSWRWVFLVSVPIGVVVLVTGPLVLPAGGAPGPPTGGRRRSTSSPSPWWWSPRACSRWPSCGPQEWG
ncbi:MAG: hypothetical protein R2749_29135 [Acidimicrobiales bacterium]